MWAYSRKHPRGFSRNSARECPRPQAPAVQARNAPSVRSTPASSGAGTHVDSPKCEYLDYSRYRIFPQYSALKRVMLQSSATFDVDREADRAVTAPVRGGLVESGRPEVTRWHRPRIAGLNARSSELCGRQAMTISRSFKRLRDFDVEETSGWRAPVCNCSSRRVDRPARPSPHSRTSARHRIRRLPSGVPHSGFIFRACLHLCCAGIEGRLLHGLER